MWEFASTLVMYSITSSLRLTAISMTLNALVVMAFGPSLGRWIDRSRRLRGISIKYVWNIFYYKNAWILAAIIVLVANRISIVLSAALLVLLLEYKERLDAGVTETLMIFALIFNAVSLLAKSGSMIIISKDWVVELCMGDSSKLAGDIYFLTISTYK